MRAQQMERERESEKQKNREKQLKLPSQELRPLPRDKQSLIVTLSSQERQKTCGQFTALALLLRA